MNYPDVFIPERADPYVFKGNDNMYYFTASYPAFKNAESGYDRIILRRSETVLGLMNAEEHTIWHAHKEGEMAKHIWAPEIHFIGGKYYILFTAADSENKWNIRPHILRCEGDNPINDKWTELGRVKATEGDDFSFCDFSLDMTYFNHNNKHYLVWAQKDGDSSIFMAEIDEKKPIQLISKPILLTKPEYPWELIRFRVNEGPAVLKLESKIYIYFSASGTGSEYCMGMLWADADADLMNKDSWHKLPEPQLSTEDLTDQSGPGHNSFVWDENGKLVIVYHARPFSHLEEKCGTWFDDPLYDPCRHARIKEVKIINGEPVLK